MGPRLWIVHLLLGFSSGLPLLLTASTLQIWMTELGVPLAIIGGLASVGLPYNFKFVWSPFIDRFPLPFLTRRRGWMVLIQVLMMLAIAALGFTHPEQSIVFTFAVAAVVAFLSATQDILIDAYRRENLPDEKMGYGLSLYTTGYRLAMLVAGAVALWGMQAYQLSWSTVYTGLSACVLIGIFAALIAPESADATSQTPKSFEEAIVGPFKQLFTTNKIWLILVFLLTYKLGDNLSSSMTAPFVIKHGYSKGDYAKLVKGVGLLSTLAGVYVGAWVMEKIKITRSLWVFGVLQALAILSLHWLALDSRVAYVLPAEVIHNKLWMLSFAIFCEMFTAGLAVPAFNTYVALLTDRKFTATQYALLTSLVALPRTLLSTPSGWIAGELGWDRYFLFCVLTTIPGMVILSRIAPWSKSEVNSNT